jgi:hypothetical protein
VDGNRDEEMHEPKGVKEAEPENLPEPMDMESAKKGIEDEKGLGEVDSKMNEGPAASSGFTAEQRQGGRESQERAQEVDEWEDSAGQLKKRAKVRASDMEVGKVGINEDELNWEEIIGMDTEGRMIEVVKEKMIAEVEVERGASDDVEVEGSGVTKFMSEHLDPEKVREARAEEVGHMTKKKLWREVDIQESWDRTGRAPITTNQVDVLKAADGETFVRSRLVARDSKVKGKKDREELFAATPLWSCCG